MAGKKREPPPDLRQEIARRAREPETAADIAEALIREASGGKDGKGGATVLKAYELVQGILDAEGQGGGEPDYSRMSDDRLRALYNALTRG